MFYNRFNKSLGNILDLLDSNFKDDKHVFLSKVIAKHQELFVTDPNSDSWATLLQRQIAKVDQTTGETKSTKEKSIISTDSTNHKTTLEKKDIQDTQLKSPDIITGDQRTTISTPNSLIDTNDEKGNITNVDPIHNSIPVVQVSPLIVNLLQNRKLYYKQQHQENIQELDMAYSESKESLIESGKTPATVLIHNNIKYIPIHTGTINSIDVTSYIQLVRQNNILIFFLPFFSSLNCIDMYCNFDEKSQHTLFELINQLFELLAIIMMCGNKINFIETMSKNIIQEGNLLQSNMGQSPQKLMMNIVGSVQNYLDTNNDDMDNLGINAFFSSDEVINNFKHNFPDVANLVDDE